jgi:SAM-dependent methyltransferase
MDRQSFLRSILTGALASFAAACSRKPTTPPAPAGSGKTEQLLSRVLDHNIAAAVVAAVYIGDRLKLFAAMAGAGPLSGDQVAARAGGLDPRYVLEWLRVMATSGYVEYQPASGLFNLPPEHAAVLTDESSPAFAAGWYAGTVADVWMAPRVLAAFRTGKGIPYGDFPPETFESIERTTKPDYLHLLTQQWLPAVPGVVERLRAGGSAADLGAGAGLASIAIARAYRKARAVGFEPYAPSVARARANARAAGVADRVRFDTFDGVRVPPGPYDLITLNYSLHHAGKPAPLLASARQALAPGGAALVVEYRKSERLEQDIDTPRRFAYAFGLLECLPAALAEGGPGYGTGILETDIRKLAREAGFSRVATVLDGDPLRSFFVLRV